MTRTNESKHDKFVRLAEARTNKIIDTLQLLGNCANTSDKAEVNEIFQAIEKELQLTKKKFTVSSPVKSSKFSLSKERL